MGEGAVTRPEPMPRMEKVALVMDAQENGATLDGGKAYVSGYENEFATVALIGGKGGKVEFAWPTVARILSTHRNFQS